MISYRKDDLEALVRAVSLHWGGQARDWRLVVEPIWQKDAPTVALQVDIALGRFTRVSTIPLSRPCGDSDYHALTFAAVTQDDADLGRTAALAAVRRASVRRASVQSLLTQSCDGDIEALLGYLRGCGVLVLD